MYKWYCRVYQFIFRLVMYALPWRQPKLIQGAGAFSSLPELLVKDQLERVLIVTDKGIRSLGYVDKLNELLKTKHIQAIIYDNTVPNPTIHNIEEAVRLYSKHSCQAIIAIGGGSPIDCAKGVGARIARPNKTISQLKGQLKIRKKLPPLYAVPTTAGTGSEATVAAVISNSETLEKYAINDLSLIPYAAILDPELTLKLPPHITSTTGMDALTHAVEAFIGGSTTRQTREQSKEAVRLIFTYLEEAYANGYNIEAREKMMQAAYLAGLAFTRSYVGNIHAIAHTLGGFYGVPHGLANSVIMPYVLKFYGSTVYKSLAELADAAGIANTEDNIQVKAEKFIAAIEQMNARMNIPTKICEIQEKDIPTMVKRALSEANPLYPVPKIMNAEDMTSIYKQLKEQ